MHMLFRVLVPAADATEAVSTARFALNRLIGIGEGASTAFDYYNTLDESTARDRDHPRYGRLDPARRLSSATGKQLLDDVIEAQTTWFVEPVATLREKLDRLDPGEVMDEVDRAIRRTRAVAYDVEAEFHRKHNYVRYLVEESVSDFEDLFAFLADLRTDEAATVEKVHRERKVGEAAETSPGGAVAGAEGDVEPRGRPGGRAGVRADGRADEPTPGGAGDRDGDGFEWGGSVTD